VGKLGQAALSDPTLSHRRLALPATWFSESAHRASGKAFRRGLHSASTSARNSACHTAHPNPNPSAIPSHETTRHRNTSTTAAVTNSTRQRKKGHSATLTQAGTDEPGHLTARPPQRSRL
jgi:hypothetical protein